MIVFVNNTDSLNLREKSSFSTEPYTPSLCRLAELSLFTHTLLRRPPFNLIRTTEPPFISNPIGSTGNTGDASSPPPPFYSSIIYHSNAHCSHHQ